MTKRATRSRSDIPIRLNKGSSLKKSSLVDLVFLPHSARGVYLLERAGDQRDSGRRPSAGRIPFAIHAAPYRSSGIL
ncbi:hypothetical protein OPQ81_010881 [Rhizoctonia solani]|nr:hypothetical protein OPQ81_010881 [Rhizoctonia solani]